MNPKRIFAGIVLVGIGVIIGSTIQGAADANGGIGIPRGLAILPFGAILLGAVNVIYGVFESSDADGADWNDPQYRNQPRRARLDVESVEQQHETLVGPGPALRGQLDADALARLENHRAS